MTLAHRVEAPRPPDLAPAMRVVDARRSVLVGYLLLLCFGLLGAHRFYTGRSASGFLLLFATLLSLLLIPFEIGWGLAWIPPLWLAIDLFLLPALVARYNSELLDTFRT